MIISKEESRVIEQARFPMSMLVVFCHTNNWPEPHLVPATGSPYACEALRDFFASVVTKFDVTGFLIIAGFFLFYDMQQWTWQQYRHKMWRRVFTLLMPLVVWNVMKMATVLVPAYVAGGWAGVSHALAEYGGMAFAWRGNPMCPSQPALMVTWFLRDTLILCLLAPVLFFCIRRLSWAFVGLLFIADLLSFWPSFLSFDASVMAYFAIGATFAIQGKSMVRFAYSVRSLSYALAVLSLIGCTITRDRFVFYVYCVTGVLSLINVVHALNLRGWFIPRWCSQSSIFLYLSHTLLALGAVAWVVNRVLPFEGSVFTMARYFAIWGTTVALLVGVYNLLRLYLPSLLYVLTGRRPKRYGE